MVSSQRRERLHQKVDKFVDRQSTLEPDVSILERYLDEDPCVVQTNNELLPCDKAREQHQLLVKIRSKLATDLFQDDFGFSFLQQSFLLLVPIEQLRLFASEDYATIDIDYILSNTETFLLLFMSGRLPGSQWGSAKTSSRHNTTSERASKRKKSVSDKKSSFRHQKVPDKEERKGSKDDSADNKRSEDDEDPSFEPKQPRFKNGKVQRDNGEKKACLKRDKFLCVLTKTADPEVCHIIPFAVNDSLSKVRAMNTNMIHVETLLGKAFTTEFKKLATGLGRSDKQWNMISLNEKLHSWWGRGKIGLKCLEIHAINITESMIQDMLAFSSAKIADGMGIARFGSNREVLTGQVFEIGPMSHDDAIKMNLMLDLQWAVLRLAALSGSAGLLEYLGDPEDDDDEDAAVHEWLQGLPSSPQ
ncbi:hypothetical protein PT974_01872 [Cladobotryum mycophilum]|uniref:HNH nuclease domain-containing protein n=1 Tax=Cladobotryum mycophilum TaxID=491253 RepID=A0ABR0SWJ2_9HYPO